MGMAVLSYVGRTSDSWSSWVSIHAWRVHGAHLGSTFHEGALDLASDASLTPAASPNLCCRRQQLRMGSACTKQSDGPGTVVVPQAAIKAPIAEASAATEAAVEHLGISLRGVRRLRDRLVELCADAERSPFREACTLLGRECPAVRLFEELTTTQLVHLWIKREDVTGTRRMAEVPELIDPADVGPPTYFISHAWMSTVAKLLGTIEAFLADAGDSVCVWLDFCAINQHDEFAQNKEDVNSFEACLKQCKGGTLVVVDVLRCNPATRGWCLYE
jgi:hypothetical protein